MNRNKYSIERKNVVVMDRNVPSSVIEFIATCRTASEVSAVDSGSCLAFDSLRI